MSLTIHARVLGRYHDLELPNAPEVLVVTDGQHYHALPAVSRSAAEGDGPGENTGAVIVVEKHLATLNINGAPLKLNAALKRASSLANAQAEAVLGPWLET